VTLADEEFVRRRTTEVTLRDGTRVLLRPILPSDKSLLIDGFRRLSPESRYRRFMGPIEELSDSQVRFLTEIDYVDHFAWVALDPDAPGEPGIGVARYVRVPGEPEVAEAAVTVVDDYQGRGVGSLLLEALGAMAVENGITRFRGYAFEDNRPLREVLRGLGVSTTHDSPGVLRVEIDLPARAEGIHGSPLAKVLGAVARGDGPVLLRLDRLSADATGRGGSAPRTSDRLC
jgi:GNAT superfamily N-acetyltransferase